MSFKVFNFVFASGATGSNIVPVTPHSKMSLVLSNVTSWNAGSGNASITIRAGVNKTTVQDIPSCTISTTPLNAIYPMPYNGGPFMSIGFGTAVTGSAFNNIDLIVYNEVGST